MGLLGVAPARGDTTAYGDQEIEVAYLGERAGGLSQQGGVPHGTGIRRTLHGTFSRVTFIGINVVTTGVLAVLGRSPRHGRRRCCGHRAPQPAAAVWMERHERRRSGPLRAC